MIPCSSSHPGTNSLITSKGRKGEDEKTGWSSAGETGSRPDEPIKIGSMQIAEIGRAREQSLWRGRKRGAQLGGSRTGGKAIRQ